MEGEHLNIINGQKFTLRGIILKKCAILKPEWFKTSLKDSKSNLSFDEIENGFIV